MFDIVVGSSVALCLLCTAAQLYDRYTHSDVKALNGHRAEMRGYQSRSAS